MYKAMAINGSPRMEKGNTARVLNAFLEGMKDAGSQVDLVYASRLKLKPCSCGEMYCWYTQPGECCVKDEMQSLYPRLREAETLILATPVFIPLPGAMQTVINRLCPLAVPLLETRHGRTRARARDGVQIRRLALVSTGGWWELGNFGTVVRIAEELAADFGVQFAGAVLRPHASEMTRDGELTEDGLAVLEAVRRAGRELASEGTMHSETLEAVRRPLVSEEELLHRYNQWV
jgi:multimeric flavodoxin WrbA